MYLDTLSYPTVHDGTTMVSRRERVGWIVVTAVLLGLAIPWFLWGSDWLILGLPVWLWWHIGWLALAAVVFYVFVTRSWGTFVIEGESA